MDKIFQQDSIRKLPESNQTFQELSVPSAKISLALKETQIAINSLYDLQLDSIRSETPSNLVRIPDQFIENILKPLETALEIPGENLDFMTRSEKLYTALKPHGVIFIGGKGIINISENRKVELAEFEIDRFTPDSGVRQVSSLSVKIPGFENRTQRHYTAYVLDSQVTQLFGNFVNKATPFGKTLLNPDTGEEIILIYPFNFDKSHAGKASLDCVMSNEIGNREFDKLVGMGRKKNELIKNTLGSSSFTIGDLDETFSDYVALSNCEGSALVHEISRMIEGEFKYPLSNLIVSSALVDIMSPSFTNLPNRMTNINEIYSLIENNSEYSKNVAEELALRFKKEIDINMKE